MKLQNTWFIGAMLGAAVCLVSPSCVGEIKFGNSFLAKAPGGNATIYTVFNSAEYKRQFLNTCYNRQYYGFPYNTDSNGNIPDSSSHPFDSRAIYRCIASECLDPVGIGRGVRTVGLVALKKIHGPVHL